MQQDSSQKTIIIASLSFIVGFGLAWLIAVNKDVSKASIQADSASENGEVVVASGADMISVQDQAEGVSVTLGKIVLNKEGWVVIHEDDHGAPGRILGAQFFDKGMFETGTVDLLRGTVAGGTYYAMLHDDNGDHAFDPKYDKPVMDDQDQMVVTTFKTTSAQQQ